MRCIKPVTKSPRNEPLAASRRPGLFTVREELPDQQRIRCLGKHGGSMRTNRTPDEWADWCIAKNRIADELKEYYQACTTGELPPQLRILSKKLDEELLKKQERIAVA